MAVNCALFWGGGVWSLVSGAPSVPARKLPTRSPWEGRKGAALVRLLWPGGRRTHAGFCGGDGRVLGGGGGSQGVARARWGKGGPHFGYLRVPGPP